jgi:uncharacterized protein YjbJ (UPF0337 family)
MKSEIFKGKWKQIRGEAKRQWGKLTDDDLRRVDGRLDRFVGVIQEKYGYSAETAQEEADRFLSKFDDGLNETASAIADTAETMTEAATEVLPKAREAVQAAAEKAADVPARAREAADIVRATTREVPAKASRTVKENPWPIIVAALSLVILLALLLERDRWMST